MESVRQAARARRARLSKRRFLTIIGALRLLDRYLLRELLKPLGYCLAGFFVFWLSFDLLQELAGYQDKQLSLSEIARLYVWKTPELLVVVLPIGLLLALLQSLSDLARHHEITAIRAAGVSLWRICGPHLLTGLALAGALFWLNETASPRGIEERDRLLSKKGKEGAANATIKSQVHFRNARHNRIWNIGQFNTETGEMVNPQVQWPGADGRMRTLIARQGHWTNSSWIFQDAQIFTYDPKADFSSQTLSLRTNVFSADELSETPAEIRLQLKFSRLRSIEAAKKPQFSLAELKYLQGHLDLNAADRSLLQTQFHARLAQPWTCVVVVLIAIPFGAMSGRRNVAAGVAASIFICFAFFVLTRIGLALGTGGYIPAWVAAWAPNALFGAGGMFMGMKAR